MMNSSCKNGKKNKCTKRGAFSLWPAIEVYWASCNLERYKVEKAEGFCTPKEAINSGEHKAAALVVNKIDALLDKFSDQINSVFFSTKLIV